MFVIEGGNLKRLKNKTISKAVIPKGVKTIDKAAFAGCTSLKSVVIPEGVKTIGWQAFSGCSSLESVAIPEGVKTIEWVAFQNCSSLKSVVIPDGVTLIDCNAFCYCTSLESVVIPEGVTEIGKKAFQGCKSLESVAIPGSVTEICDDAFAGCSSLESVLIPVGVTRIGGNAFQGCSSLKSVYTFEGVEISPDAFEGCTSLEGLFDPSRPGEFEGASRLDDLQLLASRRVPVSNSSEKLIESREGTLRYLKAIIDADESVRFYEGHLSSLYKLEAASLSEELVARLQKIAEVETPDLLKSLPLELIGRFGPEPIAPSRPHIPEATLEKPREPRYETPGFFNKKKVEAQNASLRAEYEMKLQAYEAERQAIDDARAEYNRERKEHSRQVNRRRREIERAAREQVDDMIRNLDSHLAENEVSPSLLFVKHEIEAAEKGLVESKALLNALYSKGIVHPKYANLLAVCTLYDYLDTGRCTELTGPSGAYNLYESELRANTIISKLESIEGKLDDIRDVQYSAYLTLTNVESSLASIDGKMTTAVKELSKMSEGIASIEKSSAAAAYHAEAAAHYAKVNAEIAAAPSFGIIF